MTTGIIFTEDQARVLRDAIRTDYAIREDIWRDHLEGGEVDEAEVQARIMGLLSEADECLSYVFTYQGEERR